MDCQPNPMNLWIVMYHHRHGTSAQVVETEHPQGPEACCPEGFNTQNWLCLELFGEMLNPEDDESIECLKSDVMTLVSQAAAPRPKL